LPLGKSSICFCGIRIKKNKGLSRHHSWKTLPGWSWTSCDQYLEHRHWKSRWPKIHMRFCSKVTEIKIKERTYLHTPSQLKFYCWAKCFLPHRYYFYRIKPENNLLSCTRHCRIHAHPRPEIRNTALKRLNAKPSNGKVNSKYCIMFGSLSLQPVCEEWMW
jgi:hypothetical protein